MVIATAVMLGMAVITVTTAAIIMRTRVSFIHTLILGTALMLSVTPATVIMAPAMLPTDMAIRVMVMAIPLTATVMAAFRPTAMVTVGTRPMPMAATPHTATVA